MKLFPKSGYEKSAYYESMNCLEANDSHDNIVELICIEFPQARVLDLGCGLGHRVKALREKGFEVVGVDFSEWACANSQTDIICQDILTYLDDCKDQFDIVILMNVLPLMQIRSVVRISDHLKKLGYPKVITHHGQIPAAHRSQRSLDAEAYNSLFRDVGYERDDAELRRAYSKSKFFLMRFIPLGEVETNLQHPFNVAIPRQLDLITYQSNLKGTDELDANLLTCFHIPELFSGYKGGIEQCGLDFEKTHFVAYDNTNCSDFAQELDTFANQFERYTLIRDANPTKVLWSQNQEVLFSHRFNHELQDLISYTTDAPISIILAENVIAPKDSYHSLTGVLDDKLVCATAPILYPPLGKQDERLQLWDIDGAFRIVDGEHRSHLKMNRVESPIKATSYIQKIGCCTFDFVAVWTEELVKTDERWLSHVSREDMKLSISFCLRGHATAVCWHVSPGLQYNLDGSLKTIRYEAQVNSN